MFWDSIKAIPGVEGIRTVQEITVWVFGNGLAPCDRGKVMNAWRQWLKAHPGVRGSLNIVDRHGLELEDVLMLGGKYGS